MKENVKPFQVRLINERDELVSKKEKLDLFIDSNPNYESLDKFEKQDLITQSMIMNWYINTLNSRISRIENSESND